MLTKLTTPQTQRSAISVSGPEAVDFLHAQLTSDVAALAPGRVQFSAWCTPKGRVITVMLVARTSETDVLLIVPASQCEALVRRLTMFKMRADATVEALEAPVLGALAPLPQGYVSTPAGTDPEAMECWQHDGSTVIALTGVDGAPSRRLVIGNPDAALLEDGADQWLAADIACGLSRIDLSLTEQFIPQSLNLDALGAVSFEKGCYPGQEIVARTFFLGRLKSRTALGVTGTRVSAEPGDRLFKAGGGDKAVGTVVNVIDDSGDDTRTHMVAVVPVDELQGTLHLGSDSGEPVTFAAPPYALPAAKRGD